MALTCAFVVQTADLPLQVGGDVRRPKLLKHPEVNVPVNRGAGEESGEAVIAIVVDAKGHVASAQLSKSSGSSAFDSNALLAAKKYVFEPATRNGEPVAVQISIVMNFRSRTIR